LENLFRICPVENVLAPSKFKPYNHPQSPAQVYLLVHGQILRETNEFERLAKRLNRKEKSQIASLADYFEFIKKGLTAHEEGEEDYLFPALESKFKHLSASYIFDHDHQNVTAMDTIPQILNDLRKSPDSELHDRLNRHAIAFNTLMHLHVMKENELLLPLLYQNFTTEEQANLMRQMSEHVPPEVSGPWLSKTFAVLNISDREKLLRVLMQVAPANKFAMITKMLSSVATPSDWQALILRIPELHS
jgi:hemerythrin-like domain-containing protein